MTQVARRVTVAIIVLDEARRLEELLPALDWADEVLVVDGGSEDDTVEVARRYGVRVLVRAFDNFALQRNFALAQATGQWVLFVDADERPPPRLVGEIRRTVAAARCDAYRVPIRSRIFGRAMRYSGTQDDRPVRLVRRGAGWWQGEVHEVLRCGGRVGRLSNWLVHETLPDLHAFLVKMHRYTSIEARRRVKAAEAPRALDRWWRPGRELLRRLVWKHGWLDGPQGWAFCLLSGLSEWVLAESHQRLWNKHYRVGGRRGAEREATRGRVAQGPARPRGGVEEREEALERR